MLLFLSLPIALIVPTLGLSTPPRSFDTGVHVPLVRRGRNGAGQRRQDGPDALNTVLAMVDRTRAKYRPATPINYSTSLLTAADDLKSLQRRQSQSDANLTDLGLDDGYYASVSVGTPAQTFRILMDTGSSDLWVATTQCTNCTHGAAQLDISRSSSIKTSTTNLSIAYGQGDVAGTLATDVVSLAGFTVSNQTFLAVTQVLNNAIPDSFSISGYMGLGFQSNAQTQAVPLWQALLNGNQFSNPEVSIYLARNQQRATSLADTNPGGSITFGGRNTTLFQGDVEFQDFPNGFNTSGPWWYQNVASLTLNGNAVAINSSLAIVDTGSSFLMGPPNSVADFWGQVSGSKSISQGVYSYPCNASLNVSMSFGGRSYPIDATDLNVTQLDNGQCMGGLVSGSLTDGSVPNNPSWILGDIFLKNVYTVLRTSPPSVGFAMLSDAAGGSSNSSGGGPASNGTSGGAGQNSNGAYSFSPSSLVLLTLSVLALCLVS